MEETVVQQETTPAEEPRTFTQEEVNKIVSGRLAKYSDYETLKEKAGKYDETVEASKTELQKAIERAEASERELDVLRKERSVSEARSKVSGETGVPAELLTGEDEATCMAQAEAMLKHFKPNSYPSVKDGGETRVTTKTTNAEKFAEWFNSQI